MIEYALFVIPLVVAIYFAKWIKKVCEAVIKQYELNKKQYELNRHLACEQRQKKAQDRLDLICFKCLGDEEIEEITGKNK